MAQKGERNSGSLHSLSRSGSGDEPSPMVENFAPKDVDVNAINADITILAGDFGAVVENLRLKDQVGPNLNPCAIYK